MGKVKKSGVIRLDANATNSMSVMLMELLKEDKDLKINLSKLASSILTEYHSKYFEKARPRLVEAHQDKKKHLKDVIESLGLDEIEATMKYLNKLKKPSLDEEKG